MAEGLGKFERRPVRKSSIKITKAGDGLSEALKFDPVALHVDDEVYFVLKGVVSKVQFGKIEKDDDDLARVHTVDTIEITAVSASDVKSLLDAAAQRLHEKRLAESLADGTGSMLQGDGEGGATTRPELSAVPDADGDGGDPDEPGDMPRAPMWGPGAEGEGEQSSATP